MRNPLCVVLLALSMPALAQEPAPGRAALPLWGEVVTKDAQTSKYCKSSDGTGGTCHMTKDDAAKYCTDLGMHLPNGREVVAEAAERGAKGTLESAYIGFPKDDPRVAEESLSMGKNGYREFDFYSPEIQKKRIDFYYNSSGYKAPAGLSGTEDFWFLTNDVSPLFFNAFSGKTGDLASGWGFEKAVRCWGGRPIAMSRHLKTWAPEPALSPPAPPAGFAGATWEIVDYNSPLDEFGHNPSSDEQKEQAEKDRHRMKGNLLDMSESGIVYRDAKDKKSPYASCRWKSVTAATQARPSELESESGEALASCKNGHPFRRVYLVELECTQKPGTYPGIVTELGLCDDTHAIAYDGTTHLVLEKAGALPTHSSPVTAPTPGSSPPLSR